MPRPRPERASTEAVARQLLAKRDTSVPALTSGLAHDLGRAARQLSSPEIDWLAAAIEEGTRVRIEYESARGAVTSRVIRDADLGGDGMVYAWCELREDERMFSLARILSVSPA